MLTQDEIETHDHSVLSISVHDLKSLPVIYHSSCYGDVFGPCLPVEDPYNQYVQHLPMTWGMTPQLSIDMETCPSLA